MINRRQFLQAITATALTPAPTLAGEGWIQAVMPASSDTLLQVIDLAIWPQNMPTVWQGVRPGLIIDKASHIDPRLLQEVTSNVFWAFLTAANATIVEMYYRFDPTVEVETLDDDKRPVVLNHQPGEQGVLLAISRHA